MGETLVEEAESGLKIYCEQISHHPPISSFLVEGPADLPFKIYGSIEYKLKIQGMLTSVKASCPGIVTIELPDGNKYESMFPTVEMDGLMGNEKVLNPVETFNIKDLTNNMLL